jgi:hypothetical protein
MTNLNHEPTEPTDAELEAQIVNFDPINDISGPVSVKGHIDLPAPSLSALPPKMQQRIREKLASVTPGNRDIFEREFIEQELRDNSYRLRVLAGAGEGANDYQREALSVVQDIFRLESEAETIKARLEEVRGHRTEVDPETGEAKPVPIMAVGAEQRSALETRLTQIGHQLTMLEGPEGDRRRAEALARTKTQMKVNREALADEAEARRRAEAAVREERINQRAEAYSKRLRTSF